MLSAEIRINNHMISHIYIQRIKTRKDDCEYRYRYYEPEYGKVIGGTVIHVPEYGFNSLISKILTVVEGIK